MSINKKIVYSMFFRTFMPSLVSTAGLAFGGIADAVVIGNRMGVAGLAAIAFTWPIYMIFNIISVGIGVGSSIYYARYLSEGKVKKALSLFNGCMIFCIISGVLIALIGIGFMPQVLTLIGAGAASPDVSGLTGEYLYILFLATPVFFIRMLFYYLVRADDSQILATSGMIIGNIVDILLSCLFVFGLDMGIRGVAYATVMGTGLVTLIYLVKMFRKTSILHFTRQRPDIRSVWAAYKAGFASSSQYLFQFIAITVINQLLIRTGGQTDVAIYNVITNVSYVVMAVADAATATIYPVISTFYGERNNRAVIDTFKLACRTTILLGVPVSITVFCFADYIAMFFGLQSHVGEMPIRIFIFSILFAYGNLIMSSFYQATDNAHKGALITFLRSFVFSILFAFLCTLIPGSTFWWSFLALEAMTLICWCSYGAFQHNMYCLPIHSEDERMELIITGKDAGLNLELMKVNAFCERQGADAKQTYYVMLVLEEICSAIILNAFQAGEDKYIVVVIYAREEGGKRNFVFSVRDNCANYNPFAVDSRQLRDLEDDEAVGNIGILIVKKKAKDFFYRRYQGFNTLVITV